MLCFARRARWLGDGEAEVLDKFGKKQARLGADFDGALALFLSVALGSAKVSL